jgi:hypothetical protein
MVWDSLIELQNNLIQQLSKDGSEIFEPGMERFNQPGWVNRVWSNKYYRRAHIDVVDIREQKKLWMMHVCIFPELQNDSPIYGFDVIAGPNKMTGAFHDFSATVNLDNPMIDHFASVSTKLKWKRERELPDWAKAIFTEQMIAAGMVTEIGEIDQICKVARENMCYYLRTIRRHNNCADYDMVRAAHNNYAYYQKQNPHTPNVLKSLGLNEEDVNLFVKESLFPEI